MVRKSKTKEKILERYTYVCPVCFGNLDECTCKLAPNHLIQIDRNFYPIIKKLNRKGHKTFGCCEGHWDGENNRHSGVLDLILVTSNPYKRDTDFDYCSSLPEVFKGKSHNNNLTHIGYYYGKDLDTKEKFEEVKMQRLAELEKWVDGLEDRSDLKGI